MVPPTADLDDASTDLQSTSTAGDLTQFQLNILAILAEEARYGLAVKRDLEAYYGEEINHGRLYPNLDSLGRKGLVAKRKLDERTNEYRATSEGVAVVQDRTEWLVEKLDMRARGEE